MRRRTRRVTCGSGGCPADYVPFYFAARSPMLYVISHGQVPQYRDGQDSLVYVVTDVDRVVEAGRAFVFSDGNCASAFTRYSDDLAQLDGFVDWDLMEARQWSDTPADGDRMRRRMAEFLVHEHLPWSAVIGVAVRSEPASERVRGLLASLGYETKVYVRAGWYD